MRRIAKSGIPQSLAAFNGAPHVDWADIHRPENRNVYEDCLERCSSDQGNICGYTEISMTSDSKQIDHYIKRALAPYLTFDWKNMIAAVKDSRFGADWKDKQVKDADYDNETHCYRNILNPVADEMNNRFIFSTDGTMEPSDSNDSAAVNTIRVFNLNEISLKSRRKDVMQSVRAMIKGGIDQQDILDYLKQDGFVSAIEYELSHV